MAQLESPGVSVTVIDESFYTPGAPGTVPMVFVATGQDKTNPSGSTAQGTTQANAGKVWLMTSQRDLTDTFGTPLFYTDASGNSLHGNELNEYGLQAAYSVLGVSSRAYIVRADVNLAELVATSSEPTGDPIAGTHWVDTASSSFGVKTWNSSTQKFSNVTPIVLDDSSDSTSFSGNNPSSSIGMMGDFCMVVSNTKDTKLFYKDENNSWIVVQNVFNGTKHVQISPHYTYPPFNASTATGSVWITTTTPNNGADWKIKRYDSTSGWVSVSAPIYRSVIEATYSLDETGGKAISVGTLFVESNYNHLTNAVANFDIWRRNSSGSTVVTGPAANVAGVNGQTYNFSIRESSTSTSWGATKTVVFTATNGTNLVGSYIPSAVSAAGLSHTSASWDATNKKLSFTHELGGNIQFADGTNSPLTAGVLFATTTTNNLYAAASGDSPWGFIGTAWKPLSFEASSEAPSIAPTDGTLWYNSVVDEVDIMIHNGTTWVGYKTATSPYYSNGTDPEGPIVSATEPVDGDRSDGGNLVTGDIWVSTADLERYGKDVYIYNSSITVGSKWVLQDVTDQSTPDGWLFADARWATAGTTLMASTIKDLLTNSYLDPDAPDPALYPKGMKLWNTRRSGFNVKKYIVGHLDITANMGLNKRFNDQQMYSYESDRWVSQNNVADDGSGIFGRHSQRKYIVEKLKSTVDTNTIIRDTDTLNFTLMASPGYPELMSNMVSLNVDRGLTAFVIGDTPFRLQPTGTALSEYGNNTMGALDNNDEGIVTFDEYLGVYYPSGYTNDNAGNSVVVPPSHMLLRTIIKSDNVSFPWFAPAGTRRGGVDNATSVGYITSEGEFTSAVLHTGLRDVLDDLKINPIATLSGVGLVVYGQRTRAKNASALDRINVVRLVCYLRKQLDVMARPYLFEPNDAQTRREIKAAAESILLELVGQRALYDFIVVCDETNNTAARIDRNELYVDIAIEPVKAVEYIYIPLRLKNTGEIAAGQ